MTARVSQRTAEKRDDQLPAAELTEACPTPEPLQRLLDFADGEPAGNPTKHACDAVACELKSIRPEVAACTDRISDILTELQRLKTADQALLEMHQRCQQLSEEFYEREVLGPLFHGLIGIADRCRQQVQCVKQAYDRTADSGDDRARQALRHVMDARSADRIEVENLLAHYGVESYRRRGGKFDPSYQKCVGRTNESSGTKNHVAKRILPGYRRNGRVIRPEYVHVHVQEEPEKQQGESK